MGRKKGKKTPRDRGETPRRGMRRSIRYEAVDERDDPQAGGRPNPRADAPPSIHLRMLNAQEAMERLAFQVRAYAAKGQTEVLVVHGKGTSSVRGVSVLGPLVRTWCDDHPDLVSSWREAPSAWGGSGAVVVVLR